MVEIIDVQEERQLKAQQLQESVVGLLSGNMPFEKAVMQYEDAWRSYGRYAITLFGTKGSVTGTVCEGSVILAYGGKPGLSALILLAETERGPDELVISLLDDNVPNFEFSAI